MLHLKTLAAVVGLSGAAVGAVPLAAGATAQATTPLCRSSQLVLTLERSEGAAGTHYDTWRMTNVGRTCRTQGWVGAQNYGSDGRPLTTHRGARAPAVLARDPPQGAARVLGVQLHQPRHHWLPSGKGGGHDRHTPGRHDAGPGRGW